MNESVVHFRREVLRSSVAELCQRAGWESVTCRVMEVLVDLMERYITKLSTSAKAYSELYNRQNPNLTDMWLSYKQNGIDLSELHEYLENFDEKPLTLEVPEFPASRSCLRKEEKINNFKHKHKQNKPDAIASSSSSSLVTSLDHKASATDVQAAVPKERPAKAKCSCYQMQSILSVDSRQVDAGVPSTGASASRRPQHLSSIQPSPSIHSSDPYHRHPLTPSNHPDNNSLFNNNNNKNNLLYNSNSNNALFNKYKYPDEHLVHGDGDYNNTATHTTKKHNGWEEARRKEERKARRGATETGRSSNKHTDKLNRLPLSHSTPTATLIASLKKNRKATIKEAFLSKKRHYHSTERHHSPRLHHTPLASPPRGFSDSLSSRTGPPTDKYADRHHGQQGTNKKKPGRKPRKKNVGKMHNINSNNTYNNDNNNTYNNDNNNTYNNDNNNTYNNDNNTYNNDNKNNTYNNDNNNNTYNTIDTSFEPDNNRTLQHTSDALNTQGWSPSCEQQPHINNNNNNNSGLSIGGREEVSEEILPWTDAENSPVKNNDDTHNSHNNNINNNNSDGSFINVCDKGDTPLIHHYDNTPNSPIPASLFSMATSGIEDVSKVTGLELILGSKQPSNNSRYDEASNLSPGRVAKRKTKKKSKKQKREDRDARRFENINNNFDEYPAGYNNNNNDDAPSTLNVSLQAGSTGHEGGAVNEGYASEAAARDDNLSTLVLVAVDQREKIHDLSLLHPPHHPPSHPPSHPSSHLPHHPPSHPPSHLPHHPLSHLPHHPPSHLPHHPQSHPQASTPPHLPSHTPSFHNSTMPHNTYDTPCADHNNNLNRTLPAAIDDSFVEKRKKKKKSKKRRHDNDAPEEELSKKPKMDETASLPKLTLKFGGNTVCGGKSAMAAPPAHHSNRPKGPIKLVIKPFTGMRHSLPSPSHHSGSSMLASSRSQSPDDLARLAVGQRRPRQDIYDSDHSAIKRSPIYSESPSPPPHAAQYSTPLNPQYHTLHNFSKSTPHHNPPYTQSISTSKKSKSYKPPVLTASSSKAPRSLKTNTGKVRRAGKAGKITQPNGDVIWICPTCGFPDNGSPMIGCDKCDDWYHCFKNIARVCVNITEEPPEEVSWFCTFCISQASAIKASNKRGRPPAKK